MQERKRIAEEIELVLSFKMLAEAFEEISVVKMQRVRSSVLRTRDFLSGLSNVFFDVKNSYRTQIISLMKKKKLKNENVTHFSTLKKNGKNVVVLLSANTKLYGDIVPKVFQLFMESIKNLSCDIVIVGKLGKDMFEQRGAAREYTYFDVSDTTVSINDLKALITHIVEYENVTVFYGKFDNVINQNPAASVVSGEEPFEEKRPDLKKEVRFIFEPSLQRILNFFETQIFTSLFKQTVHEYQLARYASRIKAMEEALENINLKVKDLEGKHRRAKKLEINKKQIQTMSGIALWGSR